MHLKVGCQCEFWYCLFVKRSFYSNKVSSSHCQLHFPVLSFRLQWLYQISTSLSSCWIVFVVVVRREYWLYERLSSHQHSTKEYVIKVEWLNRFVLNEAEKSMWKLKYGHVTGRDPSEYENNNLSNVFSTEMYFNVLQRKRRGGEMRWIKSKLTFLYSLWSLLNILTF